MRTSALWMILVVALVSLLPGACTRSQFQFSDLFMENQQSPAAADYSYQGTAQTKIRLGDRDHVDSVFKDVFGASTVLSGRTSVDSQLQAQLHGYIGYFGGPCDPAYVETFWIIGRAYAAGELVRATESGLGKSEKLYKALTAHTASSPTSAPTVCSASTASCKRLHFSTDLAAGRWAVATTEGCLRRNESLTSMISGPAPAREALRVELCETFTGTDSTLTVAVANAGGSLTVAPTASDIDSVWELFHFGDSVPENIATKLQAVIDTTRSTLGAESTPPSEATIATEQWRYLFLTVCRSPSWSVL